ncbi:uncharacterized protein UV8b_06842 [Ustilaginoidea virens]|uniref:Uncharacterized protein n=1 Tax=Ustilaginoidea virens TaxID=1159556 RepID=A0A8E5HW11_USTVR|nr:uncharacterized protein UV8b_06842 [Ustilaginoidea virens]QUC22601.1 hypothetical protein UV8b_06842 [Ustilaginoidea virens]
MGFHGMATMSSSVSLGPIIATSTQRPNHGSAALQPGLWLSVEGGDDERAWHHRGLVGMVDGVSV